jgi:hypothetical protein
MKGDPLFPSIEQRPIPSRRYLRRAGEADAPMRARPFSKGRISKRVPPDFAVSPYFEICVSEPLGVAHRFVKAQNMGTPPSHAIDTP